EGDLGRTPSTFGSRYTAHLQHAGICRYRRPQTPSLHAGCDRGISRPALGAKADSQASGAFLARPLRATAPVFPAPCPVSLDVEAPSRSSVYTTLPIH